MSKSDRNIQMRKERERKSILYSQNFIENPELVRSLLRRSSIGSGDTVLEIGPGKGVITEELARCCQRVIAVEKDPVLATQLRQKFAGNPKIEIYQADFLEFELPNGRYKVFSNIPFNITSEIIRKLTLAEPPPEDIYLIIQKEAAQKFAGRPYAPKESLSSILLKPWFEPSIVHHFRRTDFSPVPGVDVVLLRLRTREDPLVKEENAQHYRNFVAFGFTQWKPSLREGLKRIFTSKQFRRLAKDLNFDESVTPTELNFDQWLGLFEYFLVGVTEEKKRLVFGAYQSLQKRQEKLEKIHRTRVGNDWRKQI